MATKVDWVKAAERIPDKSGKYLVTIRERVYAFSSVHAVEVTRTVTAEFYSKNSEWTFHNFYGKTVSIDTLFSGDKEKEFIEIRAWTEMPAPYIE